MKEIKINIPTKEDFYKWWEIVKFKANGGFRCSECGNKMFFDSIDIRSEVKGKTFMFGGHSYKQPPRCTSCIQKEIDDNHEKIFTEIHKCDWCGDDKPTVTFFNFYEGDDIKTRFTFGSSWWNGHYICQPCMHEGLENGKGSESSSHLVYDKKEQKVIPQNRLGILQRK